MKTNTRFTAMVRLLVGGKLNVHMTPPQVCCQVYWSDFRKLLTTFPSIGNGVYNQRATGQYPIKERQNGERRGIGRDSQ